MRRFFLPGKLMDLNYIQGEDAEHMLRVLRMGPRDVVQLVGTDGQVAQCVIESADTQGVVLRRVEVLDVVAEPPLRVELVQGILKGDKMDFVIQKAVELGVTAIQPVITRYTVVELAGAKLISRTERWQKIAAEAAKQCKRERVPRVQTALHIHDWAAARATSVPAILFHQDAEAPLQTLFHADRPQCLQVCIGPEGGFSEHEVALLRQTGVDCVKFGPRILRAETAAIAALAVVMHRWGDLG